MGLQELLVQLRQIVPDAFIREDEQVICIEIGDGNQFADYYGQYNGGNTWIHPALLKFAEQNDMSWVWENIDHPTLVLDYNG